jgi:hypothetical protein
MTDRDAFTARPGEFDERPYSSPVPSQDGVSPRSGEPFSKLPRIAPTVCRTHDGIVPVARREQRPDREEDGKGPDGYRTRSATAVLGQRVRLCLELAVA